VGNEPEKLLQHAEVPLGKKWAGHRDQLHGLQFNRP
jgi:hypothetical protein